MTAASLSLTHFRGRSDAGDVNGTPTWIAAVDTNWTQDAGLPFRIRHCVQNSTSGAASSTTVKWQVSKNAGAFQDITASSTIMQTSAAASSTADDAAITSGVLGGTGTFVNGRYDNSGSTATGVTVGGSGNTEFEVGLVIVATDVAKNDTLQIKLVTVAGTSITATTIPTVTVSATRHVQVSATQAESAKFVKAANKVVQAPSPSVLIDFTKSACFPVRAVTDLACTRASSAYQQTAAGVLTQVGSNVARITDLGLLVEEARTNIVIESQAFAGTTFDHGDSHLTITNAAGTAPDGTNTATQIVDDTTASTYHQLYANSSGNFSFSYSANSRLAQTVYVKAVAGRYFCLTIDGGPASIIAAMFDLQTGTVANTFAGGTSVGTVLSTKIEALGATGWYRVQLCGFVNATSFYFTMSPSDTSSNFGSTVGYPTYTGNATHSFLVWGAQLEVPHNDGTTLQIAATSYIPTTAGTGAVTRAADQITFPSGSLHDVICGPTAATLFAAAAGSSNLAASSVAPLIVDSNDAGNKDPLYVYLNSPTIGDWNGSAEVSASFGAGTGAGQTNAVVGFNASARSIAVNGGTVGTAGTGFSLTSGDALWIGARSTVADFYDGYIQMLAAWTSKLPDDLIKAYSVPGAMSGFQIQTTTITTAAGRPPTSKLMSATAAQSASIVRSAVKILTATQSQAATRIRAVTKVIAAASAEAASMIRGAQRVLSASSSEAATIRRASAKSLTAAQAEAASIARSVGRTLSASSPEIASITRAAGKILRATSSSAASLIRAARKLLIASSGETATIATTRSGATAKLLSAVSASSASIVKAIGKTMLTPAPTTGFDFTKSGGPIGDLICTRSSVGTAQFASGLWQSFAANALRITDQGLLVEESRTNSVANNAMVGAAAGTPGTAPTGWTISSGAISTQIVGTGTDPTTGLKYIDVRFFGSAIATMKIAFAGTTTIAAANGDVWTHSSLIALVGGSFANVSTTNLQTDIYDGSGVLLSSLITTSISGATATPARFSGTATIANASAAFVQPTVHLSAGGAAIDITLRVIAPQIELGAFATSVIVTTNAAATRSYDLIVLSQTSAFHDALCNQAAASVYASCSGTPSDTAFIVESNNGFGRDPLYINFGNVTTTSLAVTPGSGSTAGQTTAVAAWDAGGRSIAANGSAVNTDGTSGALLPGDGIYIGSKAVGGPNPYNGYIQQLAAWAYRLPDSLVAAYAVAGALSLPLQSASISTFRLKGTTLSATQGETATIASVRAATRTLSTVQAQAATIVRGASKSLSASLAGVARMVRSVGKPLSTSNAEQATLARPAQKILSVADPQAATISRSGAKVLSVAQAQAASMTRSVAKALRAVQAEAASMLRSAAKLLSTAQPESATLGRSLTKALAAAQGQAASITRSAAKALLAASAQAASVVKAASKMLQASQGETVSISRLKAHLMLLQVAQAQIATMATRLTRMLSLAAQQGQQATIIRGAAKILSAATAQTATAARSAAKILRAAQPEAATLSRVKMLQRLIAAAQAEQALIARSAARTLQAQQGEQASLFRPAGKTLSTGAGQAASLAKAVARRLAASTGQVGAMFTQKVASRLLSASQGQAVSFRRSFSRGVAAAMAQRATIILSTTSKLGRKFITVAAASRARIVAGDAARRVVGIFGGRGNPGAKR